MHTGFFPWYSTFLLKHIWGGKVHPTIPGAQLCQDLNILWLQPHAKQMPLPQHSSLTPPTFFFLVEETPRGAPEDYFWEIALCRLRNIGCWVLGPGWLCARQMYLFPLILFSEQGPKVQISLAQLIHTQYRECYIIQRISGQMGDSII